MPKSYPLGTAQRPTRRPNSFIAEPLEGRTLLSVSQDSAGWTVITPPAGAKVIYCSSSGGNDINNGLSPSSPVKSLGKAISLLQNKTGDELLLKAGDTWTSGLGTWTKSGASAQSPMVISSYGSGARPSIDSGTSAGMSFGTASIQEVDFLAIMGIRFYANGRDPATGGHGAGDPTGINVLTKSNDILIENCLIQDYTENVNLQDYYGPLSNIQIRRNVVIDAYSTHTHSQGLYALGVNGLLLEGNVFDHNGYADGVAGANATIFNHDVYISSHNTGVVVDDNTFSRAAATGLQDRPGGIIVNNLFLNDPVDMTFGLVNGANTTAGGVSGVVSGNVFIGGADTASIRQGIGLEIGNVKPHAGTLIINNTFTQGEAGAGPALILQAGIGQIDPQDSVGINDLTLRSNTFYSWNIGIDISGGMVAGGTGLYAFNRVSFFYNQFENITKNAVENGSTSYLAQETWVGNSFFNSSGSSQGTTRGAPFTFTAPTRSVASYDSTLGGSGSIVDFLSRARNESHLNWSSSLQAPTLISYISAGFAQG